MSKIREAFTDKKAFIGFLTAGDPSLDKTEEFMVQIEKAGAALIELGIPFSDPIAEGPVVQNANVRALSAKGGCTTKKVFDMVERVREKVKVPIVFLTYLNPVFKYGYEEFFKRCQETGVDGVIIPDMPFEEKGEIQPFADKYNIDIISLVALTSNDRVQKIAENSKGYVYVMPSMSTAGLGSETAKAVKNIVDDIRKATDNPVVIEFDMDMTERISEYSNMADGIIVQNGIVKIIEQYGNDAAPYIYVYVKAMVQAVNE